MKPINVLDADYTTVISHNNLSNENSIKSTEDEIKVVENELKRLLNKVDKSEYSNNFTSEEE